MSDDMREAFEATAQPPEEVVFWDGNSKQYLPKTSLEANGHQMHSMAKRAAYFLTQRLEDFAAGARWQSQQAQGEVVAEVSVTESIGGHSGAYVSISDVKGADLRDGEKLYRQPPAPAAVPEAQAVNPLEHTKTKRWKQGWNDCREAMLSAAPARQSQPTPQPTRTNNAN